VKDFITNTFCEPKRSEEELHAIHAELISRHVAWLTAFRHSMRQPRPWEVQLRVASNQQWAEAIGVVEHRVSLEEELRGDIAEEEIEYLLAKTNKATQLLGIQSKRLRELRDENLVDDFRHVELQELLDELVALQGKSERIKNFPYPRQYATLNQTFLWIFIILLPFGVMTEFDKIGNNVADSFPLIGEYFVWFSIPFAVMVMWVFHTMERIGRVTENPFEGTPNDVPITTISRGIEIDLREMIDQDPATIPAPIPAKRDTQT
jgi:putative membrane protein